ncbi:hypothetical protein ACFSQQ_28635 [Mesorhizobium kowhaii]|uniref:hypothetical protein n=1 Tax=Mesorhizobium kowhaii TaxID=1300272 RepID=UPI0035E7C1DA
MYQAATNPAVVIPLALCAVYFLWVFFAPGWAMRREIARYERMDVRREYERGRLADALAPLETRIGADETEAAIDRYTDGR